jgi:uncharacterized protein (TIGR02265 family)
MRPLDLVSAHCDIADRLAVVPPDAMVRGIWFKALDAELGRRGLGQRYADAVGPRDESVFGMYPVRDYLVRVAFAGALVASPEKLHDGMRELSRANATYFASSLLGRGMMHLLSRDPLRVARQSVASKRHATNYGRWYLGGSGPSHLEIIHENEFVWVDSALLGAAEGTFASTRDCRCEVVMRDRFNGSIFVRW